MGFAVTLIAVPVEKRDALLEAGGIVVTPTLDADLAAPISAGKVGSHFILWYNMRAFDGYDLPDGRALSRRGADVLVLNVVDTAGAQELAFYSEGEEVWTVSFSDINADLLGSTGSPPFEPMEILLELAEKDTDPLVMDEIEQVVCYGGEVPGRIFERIVGFYHEEFMPNGFSVVAGDLPLTSEQISKAPDIPAQVAVKKPWWKFW